MFDILAAMIDFVFALAVITFTSVVISALTGIDGATVLIAVGAAYTIAKVL